MLAKVEQRLREDPLTPPSVLGVIRKLLTEARSEADPAPR